MLTRPTAKLLALATAVALIGATFAGGAVSAPVDTPGVEPVAQQQDPGDNLTQDTAYLRLVHAAPDAPAVDVQLNNETVAENVSFTDATGYLTVEGGDYDVTVTAAGNESAVVLEQTIDLDEREATTVAVTGELNAGGQSTLGLTVFTDDALEPADGEAGVSVIHLSPDAPPVDVVATTGGESAVIADNVSFQEGDDYVTVPGGDYDVEIRQAAPDDDGAVVATANLTLESGSAYSVLAVGNVVPDDDSAEFQTVLLEDATTVITVPDGNETDDSEAPESG
jgi:hypothetical protein